MLDAVESPFTPKNIIITFKHKKKIYDAHIISYK